MTTKENVTKKVQLKRAAALKAGDKIVLGHGLFTRLGNRLESQALMTAAWGMDVYRVTGDPWLTWADLSVPLSNGDVLHTPSDAYVVLAP